MREIKFRGKRKYNGEWFYGYYVFSSGSHLIHEGDAGSFGIWEVIPETVGQFTGLRDKNGKEIYEGDVVSDEFGNRAKVVWNQNECQFVIDHPDEVFNVSNDWEVIGNIHDNPELLI